MRFGLGIGVPQQSIDLSGLVIDDVGDFLLNEGAQPSAASFTSDFGVNYRFRKWDFAFAVNQLVRSKPKFDLVGDEGKLKPVQHIIGIIAYNLHSFYNND